MATYGQVVEKLREVAEDRPFVRRVVFEFDEEVQIDVSEDEPFPVLLIKPTGSGEATFLEDVIMYSFEIEVLDRIMNGRENRLKILSDGTRVLYDIYRIFKQEDVLDITVGNDVSVDFVNNSRLDYLMGPKMRLDLITSPDTFCDIQNI